MIVSKGHSKGHSGQPIPVVNRQGGPGQLIPTHTHVGHECQINLIP